jgi:adenylate cyclase
VKVQEVSKELRVRYVLEGSMRKAGDKVRITAQLIDATTHQYLWAERDDRPLQDVFALQDTLVHKIVPMLKLQLSMWEQGVLVRKTQEHLEAYVYLATTYRHEWVFRWRQEPKALERAFELAQKALALAILSGTSMPSSRPTS